MSTRLRLRVIVASLLACVALPSHATAQGLTTIVTVNSGGVLGDGASGACSISAGGQFVAFESSASNLLPSAGGINFKIFVFDRSTGILEREDVTQTGVGGSANSRAPSLSADGRFVAFSSQSSELGGSPANTDIIVRDRWTGTIECITSTPTQPGVEASAPSISGDGRYVAYAGRVGPVYGGINQIFVHDRNLATTSLVSVGPGDVPGNYGSSGPHISADGRWVTFTTDSTNLVVLANQVRQVLLRDLVLGVNTLVGVSTAGVESTQQCSSAAISADGRYVLFSAYSWAFPPQTNGPPCVWLRDTLLGTTTIVSLTSTGGIPSTLCVPASMSRDGRFILFTTYADDIVPGHQHHATPDAYLIDRSTNAVVQANLGDDGVPFGLAGAYEGDVSDDGRVIAFEFSQSPTVQIAVHDRSISIATTFCAGSVACPCGNNGSNGAGCENSFGTGGARLSASGNASVTTDLFVLHADDMPPSTAVLFFQGNNKVNNGAGNVFGDGLVCVGGSVLRLGAKGAVNGSATYGGPVGDTPISVRGAIANGGVVRFYQAWYRNVTPGYCTPSPFNLTNGVEMHWAF